MNPNFRFCSIKKTVYICTQKTKPYCNTVKQHQMKKESKSKTLSESKVEKYYRCYYRNENDDEKKWNLLRDAVCEIVDDFIAKHSGKIYQSSIKSVFRMCDSNTRWPVFSTLAYLCDLSKNAFVSGFKYAYTCGRYFDNDDIREMLYDYTMKDFLTTADEKKFYKSLSETVKIYRGCSPKEYSDRCFGFSWTTDRATAEFFAFRDNSNDGAVYSMDVYKDELSVIIGGIEYEVLFDVERYGNESLSLVTDKPTRYYDEYKLHNV